MHDATRKRVFANHHNLIGSTCSTHLHHPEAVLSRRTGLPLRHSQFCWLGQSQPVPRRNSASRRRLCFRLRPPTGSIDRFRMVWGDQPGLQHDRNCYRGCARRTRRLQYRPCQYYRERLGYDEFPDSVDRTNQRCLRRPIVWGNLVRQHCRGVQRLQSRAEAVFGSQQRNRKWSKPGVDLRVHVSAQRPFDHFLVEGSQRGRVR